MEISKIKDKIMGQKLKVGRRMRKNRSNKVASKKHIQQINEIIEKLKINLNERT